MDLDQSNANVSATTETPSMSTVCAGYISAVPDTSASTFSCSSSSSSSMKMTEEEKDFKAWLQKEYGYSIIKSIGRGSFGEVFLASNSSKLRVAVKRIDSFIILVDCMLWKLCPCLFLKHLCLATVAVNSRALLCTKYH